MGTAPIYPSRFWLVDEQRIDAPAVGAQHLEAQALDADGLPALGQATKVRDDKPADRVGSLVGKLRAERGVEVGDLRERLDAKTAARLGDDVVGGFVEVVLVLDLADDLLEHIFDRDEARDAAIL